MLSDLMKMYYACMLQDVRSPIPHLAGPPGTTKSESVAELARIVGKKLHTINVARVSPLEIEGVQMPIEGNTKLKMLHSTLWNELEEGDIVFLDEFMRGFPEVYNGFLDIMTSRHVAGLDLPKVFFVAASNSIAAYDPALTDRLLHVFVADLRKSAPARTEAQQYLVKALGLHPDMADSHEMDDLFHKEILPTYEVLDQFKGKAAVGGGASTGKSIRNLIGQVRLRQVNSTAMKNLISHNNTVAMSAQKPQYVVLLNGKPWNPKYVRDAKALDGNARLTDVQQKNLTMNLQLIEMESIMAGTTSKEKEEANA